MALLDIVNVYTPGVDPVIAVDRPNTVPSGILCQTSTEQASVILTLVAGGGVEQVSFYTVG